MAAFRILFVHGAWHGAWCFDLMRLELKRRAIHCEAVDLPSMGDDSTPLDAATFEAGVDRVLGRITAHRNTILIAHSLGAFYATEAAIRAPAKIRGIVYLASYVPLPGDTYAELNELAPVSAEVQESVKQDAGGKALQIDAARAAELFYHDVPEGIDVAASTRLKPQPLEPMRQAKIDEEGDQLRRLRRRVIVAEQDRVLSPEDCVTMAERAALEVETIPSSHSPFLSMPKLLTDMILGVD